MATPGMSTRETPRDDIDHLSGCPFVAHFEVDAAPPRHAVVAATTEQGDTRVTNVWLGMMMVTLFTDASAV